MTSLDSAMPLLLHLLQHYHNPAVATKSGKVVKKASEPKRPKKVVAEKLVVQAPKKTKPVVQDKPHVKAPKQTLKLRLPKTGKPHKVVAKKTKESESDNNAVELPIEFEEFFAE